MTINDYFVRTVEEIFDSAMVDAGGSRVGSSDLFCVRYEGETWFAEILVLIEEDPLFCPRVEIGALPELGYMARDKQVDITHTIPALYDLRDYCTKWRYRDEQGMRETYCRIRDEIFIPYSIPFLKSPADLIQLVRFRSEMVNKLWHEETLRHNSSIIRRKATEYWKSKLFNQFVVELEKLPLVALTELDKRKIAYAKARS